MEPETMVAAVAQNTRLNTKDDALVLTNDPKSVKMVRFGTPMKPNR